MSLPMDGPAPHPHPLARALYRYRRGAVRALSAPMRRLPEHSRSKHRLRLAILRQQHSLPTELAVATGDTVVQVGTPNPATLMRFARAVGPTGRLVVVEAMPDNQDRLLAAVERAGLANVHVVRAAACNENRTGTLSVSPLWGDHKIALPGIEMDNDRRAENQHMDEITVQFVRLDDALGELGISEIDFLSVTVNGAEAEVLRGAAETLRRSSGFPRVYAKGHARDDLGRPLHVQCREVLEAIGFRTMVTRGEPSSTTDPDWHRRAGDVYAWRR